MKKKQEKLFRILEELDLDYNWDTKTINRQKLNEIIGGVLLCHRNTTSSWIHSLIGLGILEHNSTSQLIVPKRKQYARSWFQPSPEQIIMPTLNTKYKGNVEKLQAKINELRKEKQKSVHTHPNQRLLLSYSRSSPRNQEDIKDNLPKVKLH
jgi:hypothetical protein